MKKQIFIFDLDKTICEERKSNQSYMDVKPIWEIIDLINTLHDEGHEIIIETARNMVTQNNNESKVIKNIGKITLEWLDKYNVKYDGLKFAKTYGSAYCDDKSIRPNEFLYLKETDQLNNIEKYLDDQNNLNIINNTLDYVLSNSYVYQWYYFDSNNKHVFYINNGTQSDAWDINNKDEIFNVIYNYRICHVEIVQIFNNINDALLLKTKLINQYKNINQCEACK